MIFLAASVSTCFPGEVVLPPRAGGRAGRGEEVLPPAEGDVGASADENDEPRVRRGPGKFSFLSTASTRRWKRRKSASARMRVDSRSILPDNSLTSVEDVSMMSPKQTPTIGR